MGKSQTIKFKRRCPQFGEQIQLETSTGDWETVRVVGTSGPLHGPLDKVTIEFDDSTRLEVLLDDINWRRLPA